MTTTGTCPTNLGTSPVSVSGYRAVFPAFADSSVYPDEQIEMWLGLIVTMLPPNRWRNMWPLGCYLLLAHQLSMDRQMQLQASRGGVPGFGTGVISNKSINGVSVGYDTGISSLQDAGAYSLTVYGVRFLQIARMVGSGGVQITGVNPWGLPASAPISNNPPIWPGGVWDNGTTVWDNGETVWDPAP